jgi:hypothetical protein
LSLLCSLCESKIGKRLVEKLCRGKNIKSI